MPTTDSVFPVGHPEQAMDDVLVVEVVRSLIGRSPAGTREPEEALEEEDPSVEPEEGVAGPLRVGHDPDHVPGPSWRRRPPGPVEPLGSST
jgi:hypothetical protein